jgi:hypothetical protein
LRRRSDVSRSACMRGCISSLLRTHRCLKCRIPLLHPLEVNQLDRLYLRCPTCICLHASIGSWPNHFITKMLCSPSRRLSVCNNMDSDSAHPLSKDSNLLIDRCFQRKILRHTAVLGFLRLVESEHNQPHRDNIETNRDKIAEVESDWNTRTEIIFADISKARYDLARMLVFMDLVKLKESLRNDIFQSRRFMLGCQCLLTVAWVWLCAVVILLLTLVEVVDYTSWVFWIGKTAPRSLEVN